ncbi:MAG: hypothetical protein ACRD2P_13310 [Terriglobia bacterium]
MTRSAEVRLIKTEEEFRACERIQQQVWGATCASAELLTVIQKSGGVVLGAIAGREVLGFLFALLARRKGRLIQWSHMMAVRNELRDRGLGLRMKLLHRKLALTQGISSICWTYDPLQSRNAMLNVARLGVDVEGYVPNYYGEFPSLIERGVPSDRLIVHWRLKSRRVEQQLNGAGSPASCSGLPRINEVRMTLGMPENARIFWKRAEPRMALEIPAGTDAMRACAPRLALRWRMETRKIFQAYFAAGYRVTGFAREADPGNSRYFYVLSRR